MRRKFRLSLSIAIVLSAFAVCGDPASLVGSSVTGSLNFAGNINNYFDPGYGFVPPADLNAAGTTVIISNSAVEFGYDDVVANAYSANFTNNQLTITDVVEGTGTNLPVTMTFTDAAFSNMYLVPVSTPTLISTFSISGDVLTLSSKGGNVTQGQVFTDTFTIQPVPEPSTSGLLSLSLVAFAISATGIVRHERR